MKHVIRLIIPHAGNSFPLQQGAALCEPDKQSDSGQFQHVPFSQVILIANSDIKQYKRLTLKLRLAQS